MYTIYLLGEKAQPEGGRPQEGAVPQCCGEGEDKEDHRKRGLLGISLLRYRTAPDQRPYAQTEEDGRGPRRQHGAGSQGAREQGGRRQPARYGEQVEHEQRRLGSEPFELGDRQPVEGAEAPERVNERVL